MRLRSITVAAIQTCFVSYRRRSITVVAAALCCCFSAFVSAQTASAKVVYPGKDLSISLPAGSAKTSTPTETTVHIQLDNPIGSPDILDDSKRIRFAFPPGFGLSPGLTNQLAFCTTTQFNKTSTAAPMCPADSKVADVKVKSYATRSGANPTGVFYVGSAFIGAPQLGADKDVYPLLVDVLAGLAHVKIVGSVELGRQDLAPGQIYSDFDVADTVLGTANGIEEMELKFRGGDNGVIVTPKNCGTFVGSAILDPANPGLGDSKQLTFSPAVTVSYDGAGAACPAPLPFDASFSGSLSTTQAGASPTFSASFERPDRSEHFGGFEFSLPAGNLARLSSVDLCETDVARRNECSDGSLIGSASITVGAGKNPVKFPAKVFLTKPWIEGHPAGMVLEVSALAGPLNLGKMAIPMDANILVPDLQMKIRTVEPLPKVFRGVLLDVRGAQFTINREGFLTNRTNCSGGEKSRLGTRFESVDGQVVERFTDLQFVGCDQLGFNPQLEVSTTAASEKDHIPFTARITHSPSQASLSGVSVLLPSSAIRLDAPNIKEPCKVDVFKVNEARGCPAGSVIGRALVKTALVNELVEGDVMIVVVPGAPLPKIGVNLNQGLLHTQLIGDLDLSSKGMVTKFAAGQMPDFSLDWLELGFYGGPRGVLKPTEKLCTQKHQVDFSFIGHNGATTSGAAPLRVDGTCNSKSPEMKLSSTGSLRLRSGSFVLNVKRTSGSDSIRSLRAAFGRGVSLDKKQAGKRIRVSAVVNGKKKTVKFKKGWTATSNSLQVKAVPSQTTGLTITAGAGAVKLSPSLKRKAKKAKKLSIKVVVQTSTGKSLPLTLVVKVK